MSEQAKDIIGIEAVEVITKQFNVIPQDVKEIRALKKGMTNQSFVFSCKDKKYIIRIPGKGTEQLINRRQEAETYQIIGGKGICDDVIYIEPKSGIKITEYLTDARVCDPMNQNDLRRCMEKLRAFHNLKLTVNYEFDLFERIEFYERLWEKEKSIYRDYKVVKKNVFSLKQYIEKSRKEMVLTHIDAVPDNFLFYKKEGETDLKTGEMKEQIRLTDWEYAGMQDPHVDIAMFCIYSLYNKKQIDKLIQIYFEDQCSLEIQIKIYCYIAVCGLLWSNWCEYKAKLGIKFGEYANRQYQYAKEYFSYVMKVIKD